MGFYCVEFSRLNLVTLTFPFRFLIISSPTHLIPPLDLYLSGNGEGDVTYAEQILQPQLKAFPKVFYSRNLAYL